MTKHEKEKIESALILAYENTLKEQDIHRERIEVMKEKGTKDYLEKLPSMGWKGVNEAMSGECYPACDQDRLEYLNQHCDDDLFYIKVCQIDDEDIRHRTYFLRDVVEHCNRIKSMAKFLEVLEASPTDHYANLLYGYWKRHNILTQLAKERCGVGDKEQEKQMKQRAKTMRKIFEVFAEDTSLASKIPVKGELPGPLKEYIEKYPNSFR